MDLKQIIIGHLHGYSIRKISRITGISRNTVIRYVDWIKSSRYTFEELRLKDASFLGQLFVGSQEKDKSRYEVLLPYLEQMHQHRQETGFTFLHHYEEYVQGVKNPYGYTRFIAHYKKLYAQPEPSMKLEHVPGEKMFIDFSGKKLSFTDKASGETKEVELFVAILPYSQYTYVTACMTQQRADLIRCCKKAMSFYGGVARILVPDNLKAAVDRVSRYGSKVNAVFRDFASHYDCMVYPTRAYRPQDKALVENAVKLMYQRIRYPLSKMDFFSLSDINVEMDKRLLKYNQQKFKTRDISREELFIGEEKSCLRALPSEEYVVKGYCKSKVQKMGYVSFSPDKTYYSVPYRFIGYRTEIHYTDDLVEVYYKHERIAFHQRQKVSGKYITNKAHLTKAHQHYRDWAPADFIQQAGEYGDDVVLFVQHVLRSFRDPKVGYQRMKKLFRLASLYGKSRLNGACKLAYEQRTTSYHKVVEILEKNQDKQSHSVEGEDIPSTPEHDNIRGPESYT